MRKAEEKRKSADYSVSAKTVFVYSKTVKVKMPSIKRIVLSAKVEVEINEQ